MVVLFIAQNIEITKIVFLLKTALFKKVITIFVIRVRKLFVC